MQEKINIESNYHADKKALFLELDYQLFIKKATTFIQEHHDAQKQQQWALFAKNMAQWNEKKPEKLMLLRVAVHCFEHSVSSVELAQLITLANYVLSACGVGLYRDIFEAEVEPQYRTIQDYSKVFQLLLDLHDEPELFTLVDKHLPSLPNLFNALLELQNQLIAKKYPERDIDLVLENFAKKDDLTQFPLPLEQVASFKSDYLAIKEALKTLKIMPDNAIKRLFLEKGQVLGKGDLSAKPIVLAISAEMIRRFYKILPYDTQILSLLAILDKPDSNLKGRIAQIKTGEGKSTILAMLVAYMASQGRFVDLITSSDYLAKRDCAKYKDFYNALGLSASHICHKRPRQEHFHAQILYGTNADFEFALLRDGLNKEQLRYSYRLSEEGAVKTLVPRIRDVVLIDEVDNMLLDNLGAARMAIPGRANYSWVYQSILNFVKEENRHTIEDLRHYLSKTLSPSNQEQLLKIQDAQLKRWLNSARVALFEKQEKRDYLVNHDIEIVDYSNTGRINHGCQWQHGIHQFLQTKHGLTTKPESLTGASVSHPTYFGGYLTLFGLTGTMGEIIEREEVQEIYEVDSFDVPPHRLSLRKTLEPKLCANGILQREALLQSVQSMQKAGRPILMLFESIEDSNSFSQYLIAKGIKNQLLNETQRESEDYIIARAGEPKMVTVATNTAGRGTDIIIAPKSLEKGGLHMVFAFYPENLRVEGQGFGRAGRQGQPGSCCMILNMEEKRIQNLIKMAGFKWILSYDTEEVTDSERLNYLNTLRSKKITGESNKRRHDSKLEKGYFDCLQGFFDKLRTLYSQFEDNALQEKLKLICDSEYKPQDVRLRPASNSLIWEGLYKSAKVMLLHKSQAKPLDWSGFVEQFKTAFVEHLLGHWSVFYSKLSDQIEGMDIYQAQKQIQKLNAELELEHLFKIEEVFASLEQLLFEVAHPNKALVDQKQESEPETKKVQLYSFIFNMIKIRMTPALKRQDASIFNAISYNGYSLSAPAWYKKDVIVCEFATPSQNYNPLYISETKCEFGLLGTMEELSEEDVLAIKAICLDGIKSIEPQKEINFTYSVDFYNPSRIYSEAVNLYRCGKFEEAIALCKQIIFVYEDSGFHPLQIARCHSTMASCYMESGKKTEAIIFCNLAIKGFIRVQKSILLQEELCKYRSYQRQTPAYQLWGSAHKELAINFIIKEQGIQLPLPNYNNPIILMMDAASVGQLFLVTWLLEHTLVSPAVYDNYPIELAACHGHLDLVKFLLADKRVNPETNHNKALYLAYLNGHLEIVKALLKQESVQKTLDFNSILALLKMTPKNNCSEIVHSLLNNPKVRQVMRFNVLFDLLPEVPIAIKSAITNDMFENHIKNKALLTYSLFVDPEKMHTATIPKELMALQVELLAEEEKMSPELGA